MTQTNDPKNEADLFELALSDLNAVVEGRRTPLEPRPALADNHEFRALRATLMEMRNFVLAIANGDLDFKAVKRGYLIGALKTLQAHLRHLTWQTQQVSSGDYSQRVDFMGEFSEAFNAMVEQMNSTVLALEETQERYKQMARTDPLTKLANRRHFFNLAHKEMDRALRYGLGTTIIMLDLDHFKIVNDTHGHEVGDVVLVRVAELLKETLRTVDVAARYGGEEFILLLPESSRSGAMIVATRICRVIAAQPIQAGDKQIFVTASLGVGHREAGVQINGDAQQIVSELIRSADSTLYKAKDGGRNRVVNAWDPEESPDFQ